MAASDHQLGGAVRSRVEKRADTTWIALSGYLNEAADLTPLSKLAGPLVVDLGSLDRINSIGVRMWLNFVNKCEATGIGLTFERCSPAIVEQMSMITNFMGARSRVKSILIPYVCLACKHEHLELLELAPGAMVTPTIPCPKCQAPMELDNLIETYAALLERAR
jgi:anti-anti-sigma regulatory factor